MYLDKTKEYNDIFLITRSDLECLLLNSGINVIDLEDVMIFYENDSMELATKIKEK